jgi:hypothetical protein
VSLKQYKNKTFTLAGGVTRVGGMVWPLQGAELEKLVAKLMF